MSKAFTMLELLFAVMLTSVVTVLCIATFNAVSTGWQVSTDYIDKMQRTDYALDQVITGLRSMYYPHDGEQNANCSCRGSVAGEVVSLGSYFLD